MNNVKKITFEVLNKYNIIHFFSCKPFNHLDNNTRTYFNIPNEVKIVSVTQVHSNRVVNVTKENINEDFGEADGLVTSLSNVALLTKLADCQSIFLYDQKKEVIGNIHAGWKGTLNKIIENALDIFFNEYYSNPEDIIACINPSLLKCCSEFSLKEYALFKEEFQEFVNIKNNEKCIIDLTEINKYLMLKKGIKEENIYISHLCTSHRNDLFHSYRKDNHTLNRNVALIYKKHDTIF